MTDLDIDDILRDHEDHGGDVCYRRATNLYLSELPHCRIYRIAKLAKDLKQERDEARDRAVMLRKIIERVDDALGILPYDDCLIHYDSE